MAIKKENDRLTIIINKELKNKLSEVAESDGRSISNYVAKLIDKHIQDIKKD